MLKGIELDWTVIEHWLLHVPAGPGSTFAVVLFPRREVERAPTVRYLDREEVVAIEHAEGRDLVFLRPNTAVGTCLDGVVFRGRAGLCRERKGRRSVHPFDAVSMRLDDYPGRGIRIL